LEALKIGGVMARTRKLAASDIMEDMSPNRRILFKNRIILLNDEITSEVSRDIISDLIAMDQLSKSDIKIHINCPGGDITQGLAIVDTLRGCRSAVNTIICGECASMATFIALQGKKRYMTSNSFWMGHEMAHGHYDYYSKKKWRDKYEVQLWKSLRSVYTQKTKLTKKDMEIVDHGELWLGAEQCLEKGIIDKILG